MSTFGYLFILVAVMLLRQVIVGRTKETPEDFRDIFVGFVTADMDKVKDVLTQRGENVPGDVVAVAGDSLPTFPKGSTGDLVAEVSRLGNAAKGYRLGGTGPEYYDCSGLVWRACKNLGYYDGVRFTSSTFGLQARGWCKQVPANQHSAGDIILWRTHHMGVSTGGDGMYSARSTAKGIGPSTVSGDTGYFGFAPTYWRVQIATPAPSMHSGDQDVTV